MPHHEPRPAPLLRPATSVTVPVAPRHREHLLAVQGTLALDWTGTPAAHVATAEPATAPLRLVPRTTAIDHDVDPAVAAVATPSTALPDPGPWTAQLVQAVVEVLAGERQRQQLVRWLSPEVYGELGRHLSLAPRAAGAPRLRRTVSSVHVTEPADGVVEASVVVVGGRRARAVALRLEGLDGRWRCTRLAVL
jgi:hypothetical protein